MFRHSPSTANLASFNRQVLNCQDDTYTLAWYLTGDEALAEAVVQAAVERVFRSAPGAEKRCRSMILRTVILLSKQHRHLLLPASGKAEGSDVFEMLTGLPEQERQVLILVDILGLSYSEAADLLDQPVKETSALLSQARRELFERKEDRSMKPSLKIKESHG